MASRFRWTVPVTVRAPAGAQRICNLTPRAARVLLHTPHMAYDLRSLPRPARDGPGGPPDLRSGHATAARHDPSLGSSKIEQDGLAHDVALYVTDRIAQALSERVLAVNEANVLVLGVSYKPYIGNPRESPSLGDGASARRGTFRLLPGTDSRLRVTCLRRLGICTDPTPRDRGARVRQ